MVAIAKGLVGALNESWRPCRDRDISRQYAALSALPRSLQDWPGSTWAATAGPAPVVGGLRPAPRRDDGNRPKNCPDPNCNTPDITGSSQLRRRQLRRRRRRRAGRACPSQSLQIHARISDKFWTGRSV